MKLQVTMKKSCTGPLGTFRKGGQYPLDETTARRWAALGLCEINRKQSPPPVEKRDTPAKPPRKRRKKKTTKDQ